MGRSSRPAPFHYKTVGRNDPGFIHNGPQAGLDAVCAGSDLMHPLGALATGTIAGALSVWMFMVTQNKWKIDDVLGVWPLHGLCSAWGGIAAGIFGAKALGGMGGVSLAADRHAGRRGGRCAASLVVYGLLRRVMGLRLDPDAEFTGADLSIDKVSATAEHEINW
jgi:Amt family ammonium transporter